ncbi:iron ABC transporter substrate-binding protein [Rhizobium sp.]
MKAKFLGGLIAATLALSINASTAHAADPATITVYNAQHEGLAREWIDGFTRDTGIQVVVRNGGDMEFANQIVQEEDASPADVFLTENSPAMALVEHAGLFLKLDKDILDQVPAEFQPSSGEWVGIAARSTVLAYDKTKLTEDQLPRTMDELADPKWKGRWSASPSGADFQAIVAAYLTLKGENATKAWLAAMKENAVFYKGNSTCMKAVNAGKVEAALIYHYYYFGDQAKTGENSANVALHYFKQQDPGAFVSISGGGVLSTAKHPKEAMAFLRWVTGKKGQEILKNGTSYEYVVGKGDASNDRLVPISDLQAPKVDPGKLDNRKVTDLMTEAGIL